MLIDTDELTPARRLAIERIMAMADEEAEKVGFYKMGMLEQHFRRIGQRDWLITANPQYRNPNNPFTRLDRFSVVIGPVSFSGNNIVPLLMLTAGQYFLHTKGGSPTPANPR